MSTLKLTHRTDEFSINKCTVSELRHCLLKNGETILSLKRLRKSALRRLVLEKALVLDKKYRTEKEAEKVIRQACITTELRNEEYTKALQTLKLSFVQHQAAAAEYITRFKRKVAEAITDIQSPIEWYSKDAMYGANLLRQLYGAAKFLDEQLKTRTATIKEIIESLEEDYNNATEALMHFSISHSTNPIATINEEEKLRARQMYIKILKRVVKCFKEAIEKGENISIHHYTVCL